MEAILFLLGRPADTFEQADNRACEPDCAIIMPLLPARGTGANSDRTMKMCYVLG